MLRSDNYYGCLTIHSYRWTPRLLWWRAEADWRQEQRGRITEHLRSKSVGDNLQQQLGWCCRCHCRLQATRLSEIRYEWSSLHFMLTDKRSMCLVLILPTVPLQHTFGEGNGPILFTSFKCNGTEQLISECSFEPVDIYSSSCDHSRDVYIACRGEVSCCHEVHTWSIGMDNLYRPSWRWCSICPNTSSTAACRIGCDGWYCCIISEAQKERSRQTAKVPFCSLHAPSPPHPPLVWIFSYAKMFH